MSNPELTLERFYLKDISFESPRAPLVFTQPWKPKVHVDLNNKVNGMDDDRYEVVLRVTVEAKSEADEVCYIAEVQYAGLFRIKGLPEPETRRVLSTLCPNTLFPYVREALDSTVVRGGFPALALAPINFDVLFEQAQQRDTGLAGKPAVEH